MKITFKVNIPDARGMDSVKIPEFDTKNRSCSCWLVQVVNRLIEMEKEAIGVYELVRACAVPWIVRPFWQEEMMKEAKRLAHAVSESSINIRTARG